MVLWVTIGLSFNLVVSYRMGPAMALQWFNGYLLEFLGSVDNVLLFHLVLTAYATPAGQMYKALFLSTVCAIFWRLGLYLFAVQHLWALKYAQMPLGLILIWVSYRTARLADEDA